MKLIFEYIGIAAFIIALLYMRQIWNLCLHLLGALKEREELEEAFKLKEKTENTD